MGRSALRVSAATMLSRVLGLVREQMFAALLGATAFADAFVVAYRIPNLARDLFAEGALSSAFVPTFADYLKNRGLADATRLANLVIGLVLVVVGAIALLGVVFAPEIVAVMGYGFDPGKQELTTRATRILFPFLPIVSLAAVAMGQLNAQERYTAPSLAPAVFNLVAIATGVALLVSDVAEETVFIGWAAAMLLGGLAQLLIQLPPLFRAGFRLRPGLDLREPGVRRILYLMAPAVIGLAATNVNIVINTFFASQQDGGAAWLNYAFRLIYLPIGVFGVAVATIATTRLAQRAAEHDMEGMRRTLGDGLRLVAFLTVPSMVGLIVLREPIVRVIFERGQFLGSDTAGTAEVLFMYALGLYAYSAVKVTAPAFYALNRPRVPLLASFSAVAVNVVLNVVLFPVMGCRGLALGTAAAATVNLLVLLYAFAHVAGAVGLRGLLAHVLRIALATAPTATVAWLATSWLELRLGTASTWAQIVSVGAGIGASVLVYALVCRLLRVRELDEVLALVRR